MAELGLDAYRFSISWPRVLPERHRRGQCPQGLDFYDHLVDALLERSITPVRHALPLGSAAGAGGSRRLGRRATSPSAFGEYAALMGRTLGDRVKHWITFNEPFAFIVIGHVFGIHAPGNAPIRRSRFRPRTT